MPYFGMKFVLNSLKVKMDIVLEKLIRQKLTKSCCFNIVNQNAIKLFVLFILEEVVLSFFGLLESHPNFLSIKSEFRAYWSNKYDSPPGKNILDQFFNFLGLYATKNEKVEHQMVRVDGTNVDIHIPKDFIFSETDKKLKIKEIIQIFTNL